MDLSGKQKQNYDNKEEPIIQNGPHVFMQIATHLTRMSLDEDALSVVSLDQNNTDIIELNKAFESDNQNDKDYQSNSQLKHLNEKLCQLFQLSQDEIFLSVHNCYLVKNVLIKGYMFLCQSCICFVAPISNEKSISKEGFLLKKGKTSSQYSSHWVILKDNRLSYYDQSQEIYFPLGSLDLKDALGVNMVKSRKFGFKIIFPSRRYYFIADSDESLNDWVHKIETSIFKSRNQGDSLKIVLPYQSLFQVQLIESDIFGKSICCQITEIEDNRKDSLSPNMSRRFLPSRKSSDESQTHNSLQHQDNFNFTYIKGVEQVYQEITKLKDIQLNKDKASQQLKLLQPVQSQDSGELNVYIPSTYSEELIIKAFPNLYSYGSSIKILFKTSGYIINKNQYIPRLGRLFVTDKHIIFTSKLIGVKTKAALPLSDVILLEPIQSQFGFYYGLYIALRHGEAWFEFLSSQTRDSFYKVVNDMIGKIKNDEAELEDYPDQESQDLNDISDNSKVSMSESMSSDNFHHRQLSLQMMLDEIHRLDKHFDNESTLEPDQNIGIAILKNGSFEAQLGSKKLKIVCCTIGTRGDVQPFIALCKSLMDDGHECTIATHIEYKDWIQSHSINFREISGNPAELMKLCVDNGMFSVSFLREAASKFRSWIDDLLVTANQALQGHDLIIESPVAMAGFHIAEKLMVPYFAAFPMPWSRTSEFPHPFAVMDKQLGSSYNLMTWVLMENVYWKGIQNQINRFRKETLGIPGLYSGYWLETKNVPFLYSFSEHVVKSPSDWKSQIQMTGYWFLDTPDVDWQPPKELIDFLSHNDNRPIVYIGFGSIIVNDAEQMTENILQAIKNSNVRAIITKGWSTIGEKSTSDQIFIQSPDNYSKDVYFVNSVPHDWLFPKVDAVVHHGGAGTTAAGLRAGKPTVIKPFFGDQYFWGLRVTDLGVGVSIRNTDIQTLSDAIVRVTTDPKIKAKAQVLGEKIRSQDGLLTAKQIIYKNYTTMSKKIQESIIQQPPSNLIQNPQKGALQQLTQQLSGIKVSRRQSEDSAKSPQARDIQVVSHIKGQRSIKNLFKFTSNAELFEQKNNPLSQQEGQDLGYESDTSINYGRSSTKPNKLKRIPKKIQTKSTSQLRYIKDKEDQSIGTDEKPMQKSNNSSISYLHRLIPAYRHKSKGSISSIGTVDGEENDDGRIQTAGNVQNKTSTIQKIRNIWSSEQQK